MKLHITGLNTVRAFSEIENKIVAARFREVVEQLANDAMARAIASSTAPSQPAESLTWEKIQQAFDLVRQYAPPPFNEIWCNTQSIKRAIEDAGGTWVMGASPIEAFNGTPVILREELPDDTLWLMESPRSFMDIPKVYAIVKLGKS